MKLLKAILIKLKPSLAVNVQRLVRSLKSIFHGNECVTDHIIVQYYLYLFSLVLAIGILVFQVLYFLNM